VIDFSASEMPENIAPVGTAGKVAVGKIGVFVKEPSCACKPAAYHGIQLS